MRTFGSKAVAAPLAAIALIMGGSLAIAAPDLGVPGVDKPVVAPDPTHTPTPGPEPTEEPAEEPSDDATDEPTPAPAPTDEPRTGPTPSIHGLCNAYQAGGYAHSTKDGTKVNPAWRSLELAAGGAVNVEAFCAAELAKPRPAEDSEAKPDKPAKVEADRPEKPEKPAKVKADKPDKGGKPDKG